MSLENILKTIKQKGKKNLDALARERRRELRSIKNEISNDTRNQIGQLKKKFDKELEIYRNLKLSKAKRNSKQELLGCKEELIENVLQLVRQRLNDFKGERYQALLRKMVDDGVGVLGRNCKVMATREEDIQFLRQFQKVRVLDGTVTGGGGVVLVSSGGEYRLDRTFEYLIEKKNEELRQVSAKILFREE